MFGINDRQSRRQLVKEEIYQLPLLQANRKINNAFSYLGQMR
jgi:hypothetical protein